MRLLPIIVCGVLLFTAGACESSSDNSDTPDAGDTDSASDGDIDTDTDTSNPPGGLAVVPGIGIGDLRMGMTYGDVKALIGPYTTKLAFARIAYLDYQELRLKVVVTSELDLDVNDQSKVIALGALPGGEFSGQPLPGSSRSAIEDQFGAPSEESGGFVFYAAGFSCQYENDQAIAIGVFDAYELKPDPPEMKLATE